MLDTRLILLGMFFIIAIIVTLKSYAYTDASSIKIEQSNSENIYCAFCSGSETEGEVDIPQTPIKNPIVSK